MAQVPIMKSAQRHKNKTLNEQNKNNMVGKAVIKKY
jgi:hypothetical protein